MGGRGPGVACCKVGLDGLLIPTAVVANLFRSERVFRWGAAGRGLGDRRSQRTGGRTTARTSLYKTNFSPVLDGRVVEKSRENRSSGSHQRPSRKGPQVSRPGERGWPLSDSAARSSSLPWASLPTGRRPLCRAGRPSRDLGFLLVSPLELWLCFRPSAPAVSDLSSCDSRLCFDSKLALFGAFWGVVTSSGRHCPTPSPCPGWPAACAPSWDKIPILSFVASSMTRWNRVPRPDRSSLCHWLAALPFIAATGLHLTW